MKQFQASSKKIKDAKAKGDFAKSKDVSSYIFTTSSSLALVAHLYFYLDEFIIGLFSFWKNIKHLVSSEALKASFISCLQIVFNFITPLLIIFFLLGIVSHGVQNCFFIDFKRLKLINSKFDLIGSLKKFFPVASKSDNSMILNVIKFISLLAVLVLMIFFVSIIIFSIGYDFIDISELQANFYIYIYGALYYMSFMFFIISIIAVLDYFFIFNKRKKRLMMDSSELKKEFREMEGDPHLSSMRKDLHQEILSQATLSQVRHAKVVVVN